MLISSMLLASALGLLGSAPLGTADEAAFREIWSTFEPRQKRQLCELLLAECRQLSTPQAKTIYWVLDHEEVDAGFWGPAQAAPLFSAQEHAPQYGVQRKSLAADSELLQEERARLLPERSKRQLLAAFRYDWASGTIVRCADPADPELIFENALNGYYPGQDLALAIVLKDLDDGGERRGLAAFGHAYARNEGEVINGVTLYDAFLSRKPIEMPDVDALGLLHETLGEWDAWSSPISEEDQQAIYQVLSAEFAPIRRYRQLRETAADLLFLGEPIRRNAFHTRCTQLQALWIQAEFEPAKMRGLLPGREKHEQRMLELGKLSHAEPALFAQASQREVRLKRDRALIPRVLKRMLGRVQSQR